MNANRMTTQQTEARRELTRAASKAQDAIAAEAHRIKRNKESAIQLLRLLNDLTAAVRAQALFDAQAAIANIDAPTDYFGRLED